MMNYFQDENYDGVDFGATGIPKGEYENCKFANCRFSDVDLSSITFSECVFEACDFSTAKLHRSSFRDVVFRNSKMLGLRFDECTTMLLSFSFEGCTLDLSSFYGLSLKKMRFKNCKMHETEFSDADLTGTVFDHCDLDRAVFVNTNLESVNFLSAYNFSIDPERNKMKKAKFSLDGLPGLLNKYNIVIER